MENPRSSLPLWRTLRSASGRKRHCARAKNVFVWRPRPPCPQTPPPATPAESPLRCALASPSSGSPLSFQRTTTGFHLSTSKRLSFWVLGQLNTFCFGYHVGYKFVETSTGGCNGNYVGIGADDCNRAILVEQCEPWGLLIV